MLMDGQFEPIRGDLADMQITLNTVSAGEHVPEIERYIRAVKERVRCIYNTLPFKRMPGKMIIEMVSHSVFWLNMFPPSDGISKTLSPRTLVVGLNVDYNKHCRLEFGEYAQVHEEHDNSMVTRTTGAIALRPTGNSQGGYYFLSLSTGRRLNRNHWTPLPMPAEVVNRVHVLARRSQLGLSFADRDGNTTIDDIDNDDDKSDEDYDPATDPDTPDPEDVEAIEEEVEDDLDNGAGIIDNEINDDDPTAGVAQPEELRQEAEEEEFDGYEEEVNDNETVGYNEPDNEINNDEPDNEINDNNQPTNHSR
jgi:hypothetical protein